MRQTGIHSIMKPSEFGWSCRASMEEPVTRLWWCWLPGYKSGVANKRWLMDQEGQEPDEEDANSVSVAPWSDCGRTSDSQYQSVDGLLRPA